MHEGDSEGLVESLVQRVEFLGPQADAAVGSKVIRVTRQKSDVLLYRMDEHVLDVEELDCGRGGRRVRDQRLEGGAGRSRCSGVKGERGWLD